MVSVNGSVLWSQELDGVLGFSTTGQALYSAGPIGGRFFGQKLKSHSLSGATLRAISLTTTTTTTTTTSAAAPRFPSDVRGAVMIGDGSSLVVVTDRQLRRVTVGPSTAIAWVQSLTESYMSEFTGLHAFDANRVIVSQANGGFQLVNVANGSVQYVFDPVAMAANNGRTRDEWARYRMFLDDEANHALLFDGTATGYAVDLSTGSLEEVAFDVSAPPGSVVVPKLDRRRFPIIGPTNIRVRTVSPISSNPP
jgi:hypothetical protein